MNNIRKTAIFLCVLALYFMSACTGGDYTPTYFKPSSPQQEGGGGPNKNLSSRRCTINFTSQLCVSIKGDNISAGMEDDKKLCANVAPFPIHIEGNTVTLDGSEFPDIPFEGSGLPAPITINARGDGDGTDNIGEGTIDQSGNIEIKGFSLFILTLGIVGEIPDLTLTTGNTKELPDIPSISGSPPDASGAMTLVIGKVLGSVIPAADKYLRGASMIATLTGSISPSLSKCGGEAEHSFQITKLIIDKDGKQKEEKIPDDKYLEISGKTFIAENPNDIGSKFETSTKFKIKNISSNTITVKTPRQKGLFYITSLDSLERSIVPQHYITIKGGYQKNC